MHAVTQHGLNLRRWKPELTAGISTPGTAAGSDVTLQSKKVPGRQRLVCLINTAPSIIHMQKYCFTSTNAGSPDICTPALCSGRSIAALRARIPLTHLQQPQLFQHSHYGMNHSTSLHLITSLSILIYSIFYVQCQRSSLKYIPTTLFIQKNFFKKNAFLSGT